MTIFLALLISVSLPVYFAGNLNPVARKFTFLGLFEVGSSQIQVSKKFHFEVEIF